MPLNANDIAWDEKDISWDDPNKIERTIPANLARKAVSGEMQSWMKPADVGRGVIRPAMQMGGAALGATATAPIPGASIVGAGAGYLGGGKLYDIGEAALGAGKPKTSGQVIGEMPKEFVEGMGSQALNIGIDKFAIAAKPYLARMAEKVYSSAAKMPLSKSWVMNRQRVEGEVSDRLLATRAGLENKIPISEKGVEIAKTAEASAKKIVDETVDGLSQITNRADLLKGLNGAYERAAVSGDPQGAARIIDSVAKKFMKGPQNLTPRDVLNIKRQMYKEASDYGMKFKSFHESATKGISHEAMSTLESMKPELARLNQNDAAYIKLTEALEKATSREANKYAIGLQDAIGVAGGGAYGALKGKGGDTKSAGEGAAAGLLFTKVMRDPAVLSQLAFALNKASKLTPNPLLERVFSTVLAKGAVSAAGPSTAEASPGAATALRDRRKTIDAAVGEDPAPQHQAQASQQPQSDEHLPPVTTKKWSDGTTRKWDEQQQAWVVIK